MFQGEGRSCDVGSAERGGWRDAVRRLRATWLWLPAAPALLWLAGGLYLPVLAPALAPPLRWLTALAIVALAGLSLAAHGLAHGLAARRLGAALPARITLGLLGDPAQLWPPAPRPRHETMVALAGPAASAALAGLAALLWLAQLAPALDAAALAVALLNGGLAALNLAPGFPLDGGRLLRLALRGAVARPAGSAMAAGVALAGALLAWAGLVAATGSRLSGETGLALGALAALILLGLARRPPAPDPEPPGRRRAAGPAAVALLGLALLACPLALLPVPYGLFAPGGAVPVAPMVEVAGVAPEPSRGALLLTTVVSQTPILVAQWLAGRLDPAIILVPPERVVPPERSPQELMAASARMLDESQIVAAVAALRQAGYTASITGEGARVLEILPESPAGALLRPGDRIVALAGEPVATTPDLLAALGGLAAQDLAETVVVRDGRELRLGLPLLAPAAPGGPPRLGVAVATAGLAVDSPIAVAISPQGILGGPSAGLMFALAIYDRLTPGDLTGGRRIAGTGTVSADGQVGPVGGVAQKVAAAERAGADYFLVPHEHAAEARRAASTLNVIAVRSLAEAVAALEP